MVWLHYGAFILVVVGALNWGLGEGRKRRCQLDKGDTH